jgi:hypothetical protein
MIKLLLRRCLFARALPALAWLMIGRAVPAGPVSEETSASMAAKGYVLFYTADEPPEPIWISRRKLELRPLPDTTSVAAMRASGQYNYVGSPLWSFDKQNRERIRDSQTPHPGYRLRDVHNPVKNPVGGSFPKKHYSDASVTTYTIDSWTTRPRTRGPWAQEDIALTVTFTDGTTQSMVLPHRTHR